MEKWPEPKPRIAIERICTDDTSEILTYIAYSLTIEEVHKFKEVFSRLVSNLLSEMIMTEEKIKIPYLYGHTTQETISEHFNIEIAFKDDQFGSFMSIVTVTIEFIKGITTAEVIESIIISLIDALAISLTVKGIKVTTNIISNRYDIRQFRSKAYRSSRRDYIDFLRSVNQNSDMENRLVQGSKEMQYKIVDNTNSHEIED